MRARGAAGDRHRHPGRRRRRRRDAADQGSDSPRQGREACRSSSPSTRSTSPAPTRGRDARPRDRGLQSEEWGGETSSSRSRRMTGEGIERAARGVLLQAEMLELKAEPERRRPNGIVLEAYLDNGRGPVANVLVAGRHAAAPATSVVAGSAWGKVRAMTDDRGKQVAEGRARRRRSRCSACPKCPTRATPFYVVTDRACAQQVAERRKKLAPKASPTVAQAGLDALLREDEGGRDRRSSSSSSRPTCRARSRPWSRR